ncbi:alpha-N-arabinofuranosidase [Chryseolinea lacunae]|uniref:non-reducing end alpha-L-arabinofuranosidase n=1 Tax=Chryseolinea lacunae TaxID=2801331 RepID=A0ABS1KYZ1_9BACT|nr:alpha-N-arabinofuranosidase [Chryseolinea lacunae]MBL0744488.1 alpha-N-arabinofuranosidase [Chryseolinea lacunae]
MKHFLTLILTLSVVALFAQPANRIVANPEYSKNIISKHIYGHFSEHLGHCIYGGYFVDEGSTIPNTRRIRTDIVDALKKIKIPNLRWPGGCFADEYHWNDGIGLRSERPKMVNTNWGGVTEDNSFGTHEFLDLCEMLGTEPYICGNVGSGTVAEMSKWVEYLNFDGVSPMADLRKKNGHDKPWKVRFWGVGNENWGCGGSMTAEFYADQYRRYATYARNYGDAKLMKIAGGANSGDYHWTETLMKNVPLNMMWGISLHYYTIPKTWASKGSATAFGEDEYFSAMKSCLHMEELVSRHSAVMDQYDPEKRVALAVDEWGIWTDVEPGTNPGFLFQQNSLRDALIAASTLNIFNNHSDRVRMSNLAQTVNVLQALILTDKEKMLLTPTYHIYDLYQVHQEATLIPLVLRTKDYVLGNDKLPALNASASRDKDGNIHISVVNIDPTNAQDLQIDIAGTQALKASAQILTSEKYTDHNTFEKPNALKPAPFAGTKKSGESISLKVPAKSVVMITLAK